MPETITPTEVEPSETPTQVEDQGNPGESDLGDKGKAAIDRMKAERDEAKRNAATLKAQLDKIAEANLSDLDKARKEAEEFKSLAEKATIDALRFRIAAEAGITENVDLILTAPDEETMRRQAALWASKPEAQTAGGPRADLSQGGSGTAIPLNGDGLEDALKSKLGIV